jgi:putative N6-adenine-specific DNA methylase
MHTYDAFAITAPGLAPLADRELRALGVASGEVSTAGVEFAATAETLYAANLWLRTATRVIVRIGRFRALAFADLQRLARQLSWERFIAPGAAVRVRVTCHKSKLYHSDAVGQRIMDAIAHRTAAVAATWPVGEDESGTEAVVIVRLDRDVCTVNVDSSGALLHRRGYRLATAKAPLRETLAAAVLLASEWDTRSPLVDPLCGAGTIPIEAALMARQRAPGLGRDFGCTRWPEFDRTVWQRVEDRARATAREGDIAPILASDRDAGATAATLANAERAGVAGDIAVRTCALSAIEPPPGPGALVTNPPYGLRIGDPAVIRNLYAQLGHVARAKCPGWTVALIAADRRMVHETGLALTEQVRTTNGGIPVALVSGRVD